MSADERPGRAPEALRGEDRSDSVRDLARHSTVYAVAPIAQRLIALLLIRFYTAELDTAEWGVLALADLLLGLLPLLVGSSLLAGMSRFYFLKAGDADRDRVVSTVAVGVALTSLAISGAGWLARDAIAAALFSGATAGAMPEFVDLVSICLVIFPLAMVTATGLQALQLLKRSRAVVRVTLAKSALEAGLKLWFLLGLGLGVRGFLLAVLIGEAVAAAGLLTWLLATFGARPTRSAGRALLRYCAPIVPVALFQLGLHQSDKLLLERLGPTDVDGQGLTRGLALLGVYALGYQVPYLLHVTLSGSFQKIWQPNAFASAEAGPARAVRVGRLALTVLGAAHAAAALFASQGVRVLTANETYHGADAVVPWIAAAYLGYAAYALAQTALMASMRTGTLALLNGGALLLNVGLNVALIPEHGILGAAAATLVSFWALALAAARASRAAGVAAFEAAHALVALAAVAGAGALGAWIDGRYDPFTWPAWALKCGAVVLLAAFVHRALPGEEPRGPRRGPRAPSP
ncbi:MAG: polysaccharide biosynthesis C-terminal domain-containing protein [Planctomycetota bacterium]